MESMRQEMRQMFQSNAERIQTETSNASTKDAHKRQRPNTPAKAPRTKVSLSPEGGDVPMSPQSSDAMNSSEDSNSESSKDPRNTHPGGPNHATLKHSRKHEKQKA